MKILKIGLILLLAFSFLMVPQALINQDFLHEQMDRLLQLKIRPAFSGGERKIIFRDNLGDLTAKRGHDILSLSLYEPQRDESWGDTRMYWQISYRFESLDLEHLRVQHYFNFMDESDLGSFETAEKRAERVTFEESYPWQYLISIYGDRGTVSNYDGSWEEELTMNLDYETSTIYIRIPLEYKPLRRVYRSIFSYHYLLTGVYDPVGRGKFRTLDRESLLKPKITDYLCPREIDEEVLLASYNEEDFSYVTLTPVIYENDTEVEDVISDSDIRECLDSIETTGSISDHKGIRLFNEGKFKDAEEIFRTNLAMDGTSVIDMAYLGSVIAMKAGESDSVSESVELVLAAYEYLDAAVDLAEHKADKIEVYLNRIGVSLAVPDSVFHKEEIAFSDLFALIEILDEEDDKSLILECYWKIMTTYKRKKMIDEYYIYRDHLLNLLNRSGIDLPL